MVVRRHDNGALEIVSEGTETQFISRDLLTDVVALLNERHAEIELLRAAGDALAQLMPHAYLDVPCRPPQGTPLDEWCSECAALAAWQEARRER
jgi:hypothetical protein